MSQSFQNKHHSKTQDFIYLAIGLLVLSMVVSWAVELLAKQIFSIA